MRVDNFGRQSLRFCPSITTIFENDRFLRLEGISGQNCDPIRRT